MGGDGFLCIQIDICVYMCTCVRVYAVVCLCVCVANVPSQPAVSLLDVYLWFG